jgi:hypothetical protein
MNRTIAFLLLLAMPVVASAAEFAQGRVVEATPAVLSQRTRVAPVNEILKDRLENLLPALMREAGIDMWLVINREYMEDPVYLTLVPEPVFAARRTTMLVFFDRGAEKGVERLTVSRYALGSYYESAWEGGRDEDQWKRLASVIKERNPKKIGINTSRHWAFGDGLTSALRTELERSLDESLRGRIVSAEALAVRWLETRTAKEMEVWPHVVALARSVIGEAFSNRVITPGVTTTEDVAWYIRQRFADLDLPAWFMPYVNLQRQGEPDKLESEFYGKGGVIERGDVLHTDVGICYLRLCTDTQEMGYVLRPGETDVPEGLKKALAAGNRWQDILTSHYVSGRTGNEILAKTNAQAKAEGLASSTYSHPLGFFGHAPGPTIGMWDNQGPTPVRGDWVLHPMTGYAIEGNVKTRVPEWDDQWVQIKLEQSAIFDGASVIYLAGRQTTWHVVE